MTVDRSGARRTLSKGWGDIYGAAWRPDGREVWFTAGKSEEFKALRAVTLDGKERLVTRMIGQIDLQDIARDGRVLLTHASVSGDLHTLTAGASTERDLTWLGLSTLADLSADGRRVLFTELPEGGAKGGFAYLRNTDATPAIRLGDGQSLALSPDGKWALCFLTSPVRLVLLPTVVGERKTLPARDLTDVVGPATWFPDSRHVLFIAATAGESARGYVQDIEGGQPKAVGPAGIRSPSVSPDGQTIAAWSPGGPVLFSANGGEPRACRGTGLNDQPLQWSADGDSLFVSRPKGRGVQIFRIELATARQIFLYELGPQDPAGATPLRVRLTPDGRSYAYSFRRFLHDLYLVEGLK